MLQERQALLRLAMPRSIKEQRAARQKRRGPVVLRPGEVYIFTEPVVIDGQKIIRCKFVIPPGQPRGKPWL